MRRRPRSPNAEELALWQDKMRDVERRRPAREPAPAKPEPSPAAPVPPSLPPFRIGERPKAVPPPQPKPSAPAMDAKTHERLKRGKLRPERKLDLHGMTLDEAHPTLIRFVLSCHAEGCRLVLVVTGKGRERPDDGPIPRPKGLLRHHVPGWLRNAPLRAVVLDVVDAHIRHGGGGALYVYLRRKR